MTRSKTATFAKSAIAIAATLTMVTACSSAGGENGSFAEAQTTGTSQSVSLLDEPWADLQAENVIAKQILTKLGYTATIQPVSVAVGAKSMATGDIDAFLGNWWPSQKPTFDTMIKSGDIKVVGTVLKGTEYAPAVPGDTAKKLGITSLADLAQHASEFGSKIYGIEQGAPANATIQKMITDNDYGLGGWEMVESSTSAMLTQVERATKLGQPIAFLAWSPHWMVPEYDVTFLKDPLKVWPGAGEIRTIVRADFAKTAPDITKFLGNMKFTFDDANGFYTQHDKEDKSFETIAQDWIKANPDQVKAFLKGVKTSDGKPADKVSF